MESNCAAEKTEKEKICEKLLMHKGLVLEVVKNDYNVPIVYAAILKIHGQLTELAKVDKCEQCTCCRLLKKLTAFLLPSKDVEEIKFMAEEVGSDPRFWEF